MDIPWDEYKSVLRKAYFGDFEGCVAPRDSETGRDFWQFFKKYLTVAARKHVRADRDFDPDSVLTNEAGLPSGPYVKFHRENIAVELDKTSRYALREVIYFKSTQTLLKFNLFKLLSGNPVIN